MMKLMLSGIACLMMAGFASAADKTLDEKRQDPSLALAEALRLAEAKEWKSLIETFAPPEERKKMTEKEIAEFMKMMDSEEGKGMIAELKAVKDVKPVLSDKDTKALFETKVGEKTMKVTMIKVEKYWYLK